MNQRLFCRLRLLLVLTSLVAVVILACQSRPARFAHREHLGLPCGGEGQRGCLTCVSCHENVLDESTDGGHPEGGECEECHRPSDRKVHASLSLEPSSAAKLAAQISFDHEFHLQLDQVSGQCVPCHGGLVEGQGNVPFPPMSECFSCHNHEDQWEQGICVPCHRNADLKKLFPQTYLKHGPGWNRGHGAAATESVAQCKNCHTAESCDDCHDVTQGLRIEVRQAAQIDKNFVHPADFVTRHAMEAASEPGRCLSCHRTETCDSCHIARGVSAAREGAVNPHPPGWTGPDGSAPNHHGRAARLDILSCASCHDQGPQTNCIGCHRVGGPGGNPHPAGWKSSRTPSDVMCSCCHEGGP